MLIVACQSISRASLSGLDMTSISVFEVIKVL